MKGTQTTVFNWDAWYESVGGRSIRIEQVDTLLARIREDQYPRFRGEVNESRTVFERPEDASRNIKEKAIALGADEAGIAAIETSDIYKGREIDHDYAVVVGQKMLWRAFQNRLGSVATSMPLQIDQPIDAGIARFCDTCKACRLYCPADAIPDERSKDAGKDHLGNDRYIVDTGRCFPYFAKHNYCSMCLPVCVYNHKEWARDFDGFKTGLWPRLNMPDSPPPAEPAVETHAYPRLNR